MKISPTRCVFAALYVSLGTIFQSCSDPADQSTDQQSGAISVALTADIPVMDLPPLGDDAALFEIGRDVFHHDEIRCSHCHLAERSFFSVTRQALGPDTGTIHGLVFTDGRVDVQNVVTPTSLNARFHPDPRQLHDGRANPAAAPVPGTDLTGGKLAVALANDLARDMEARALLSESERGFFVQAIVALQGHNTIGRQRLQVLHADFADRFQQAGYSLDAVNGAPGSDIYLEEAYALALARYQARIVSDQSPVQRALRGELQAVNYPVGLQLFRERCTTCHATAGGSGGFVDIG
ncbi:MAG: cytochrome c peroxidase, partial [Verrucomicrobiota bacterium]